MPTWPLKDGRRHVTLDLAVQHVDHLDREAQLIGLTRAGYIRQLIHNDIIRQGRIRRQEARKIG